MLLLMLLLLLWILNKTKTVALNETHHRFNPSALLVPSYVLPQESKMLRFSFESKSLLTCELVLLGDIPSDFNI